MKEFLLADIGIDTLAFIIFITISVCLGFLMGWKTAKDSEYRKNLDRKCPYCGHYTHQIKTMKQVDRDLERIKKDKQLDAMLKKADKAMKDADRYMEKQGFPIIVSEDELKRAEKEARKKIKRINKIFGVD